MSESTSIIKNNPLNAVEDYHALRRKGIENIEKMGSARWTDFNYSDPGITILEAVCYAITDLAYRTGFSIKDLLTQEVLTEDCWKQIFYTAREILHNSPLTINDYRKLIIDVSGVRNAWIETSKDYEVPLWIDYNYFEEAQKNYCCCEEKDPGFCYGKIRLEQVSPVFAEKFRKEKLEQWKKESEIIANQLKDNNLRIKQINQQIKKEKDSTIKKELIKQRDLLSERSHELKKILTDLDIKINAIKDLSFLPSKIIELEGLYNILVEYEEDVLTDDHRDEIRQRIVERLARHRNVGEDVLSINTVDYEDFGIRASIALEENADPDLVLAQIFFTIYKYFTPSIPFHTIQQMFDKGYLTDEIFEGPALKHGFIDDVEMERTDLFRDIRLSDIINEISDIKGIKAITYMQLPFAGTEEEGEEFIYFKEWVNNLQEQRKIARIVPMMSQVVFCKDNELITYYTGRNEDRRPERTLKLFTDLKVMEKQYKLEGAENDFPVPVGEFMELEGYYPITYSLPMCYGTSERAGLPADADEKRKIQALQLKGYLLFFEQIIAGYLVQLNHLRDLFTFDNTVKNTYFSGVLTEINDLKSLVMDHAHRGEDHWDLILDDFTHILQSIVESPDIFTKRRNIFLNHMLARFGEDMSEYEDLCKWLIPDQVEKRMIQDKINILKDGEYFNLSTGRGRGYNYTNNDVWDTCNVSGAERRISRLLGFSNISRRTLAPEFLSSEPLMIIDEKTNTPVRKINAKGEKLNIIKLIDLKDKEKTLLTSVEVSEGCCTELLMEQILEHADDRQYYVFRDELKHRTRKTSGTLGIFWFELCDGTNPETAVLLASGEKFEKREDREKAFKRILELMLMLNNNEGLHLIEHILLRPKLDVVMTENGTPQEVKFLKVCLDICDLGIGLRENTDVALYQTRLRRIPADICYDKMPWILEYLKLDLKTNTFGSFSILFQKAFPDGSELVPLKFRRYEVLAERIKDIREYGTERENYVIVSNQEEKPEDLKYSFILYGSKKAILAQSAFIYNRKTQYQTVNNEPISDDIEIEIQDIIRYLNFQMDFYCAENPCDNNEDPYSFRTTAVLPCWPKRFRNPTFRNLVEKTIQTQSPAHVHTHVMWVGIQEMKRFEKVYFDWLKEMSQTEIPAYEIVNPLVDVLNTLVHCGYCQEECT